MDDKRALALKIRELRQRAGMTQDELADQAKVALRALQRLESASGNPTLETILAVSDILKFNPFAILSSEAVEKEISRENEILDRLERIEKHVSADRVRSTQKPYNISSAIPQEIRDAWPDAAPEIKALFLYMFLEEYSFVDALPETKKAKVLAAVRALGLNLPTKKP